MTRELEGYRALVTGASGGIGEAIARALAGAGAEVLVHGRNPDRTAAVAADLGARSVVADFRDVSAPRRLVEAAAAAGGLDILVNNAGAEEPAGVPDLTPELAEEAVRVNYLVPVELVRRSLPLLEASGRGSVVNVTSIHESVPVAFNSAYAAAKAALASFTRSASIELGPRGVRINNLAPGAVRTEMNGELLEAVGPERFARWIPLGRVGLPGDVVAAALFLAGPASAYVTGSTLTVDGGYSNHLVRYAKDA